MSRQVVSPVLQVDDLETVLLKIALEDFTCSVTTAIFFDPVMTGCGQHVERSARTKLKACPCCNITNCSFNNPSAFFKRTLQATIDKYNLHHQVYFDLPRFKQVVAQNELNTPMGERLLTLLQHASSHLNNGEIIRTETQTTTPAYLEIPEYTIVETRGESAIEILASTPAGRDYLRKTPIDQTSGKYLFGSAEITAQSLEIKVNGKSIREWLSMTTAMEKFEKEALERIKAIDNEERIITVQKENLSNQFRLFLSRGAQGVTAIDDRVYSELQPLLNAAFDARLDTVKDILEKPRPENRGALLSPPADANYPETEIHLDTAFKVALATGDEEMAAEIAQYLDPTEIARQFKNVFGPDYAAFLKQQEKEAEALFEGLEAAFNGATPIEVRNALNQVPNTTSALQQKITEFKTKLEDYVNKTRPLHNDFILAKAYEIYDKNCSPWTGNQCCLFSQPVIGLIQERYLKTSKKRSMDIAEGIYNRAQNIDKHLPARRSLLLAGSTTDIRSVVDLGSPCCIDIRARTCERASEGWAGAIPPLYKKLCRAKTSALENLCGHRNHINHAVAR